MLKLIVFLACLPAALRVIGTIAVFLLALIVASVTHQPNGASRIVYALTHHNHGVR